MGETPVALDCFLSTNLWFIFEDMAGHGRDPFVLGGRKGEGRREKRDRERERGWEEGKEGRKEGEREREERGREDLIKHTTKGGQ